MRFFRTAAENEILAARQARMSILGVECHAEQIRSRRLFAGCPHR
jgi:hypothetical protein